jgi:multidrug efflux system membrane fusion protein
MIGALRYQLGHFIVLATVLAAGALVGCDRDKANAAAGAGASRPPPPVSVVPAMQRNVPVYIDAIGRIAARESVSVVSQVGGMITARHFVDGARVKKGDLLFEIDARPFEAALAAAEAAIASAQANLAFAKQQWTNVEGLQTSTGAVSKEEMQQRKSAVAVAEAQVKSGEAAIEVAKLNLAYCKIVSPITGRAGQVMIDPGNVVKANEGVLVNVQELDPVYTDFTVTERELQDVRRNMANGTLRVEVSLPKGQANVSAASAGAAPGMPTTASTTAATTGPAQSDGRARIGELTFLDNTVQSGTGTVKLRATIANSDEYFWPGQFVEVRLVLQVKKDAVLVPNVAVQIGQHGHFVFVVKAGGDGKTTANMAPVKVGQRQGDNTVIEEGVAAGDNVVVSGHMMIMPGGPVQVIPNPNGQGAPAPQGAAAQGDGAPATQASR